MSFLLGKELTHSGRALASCAGGWRDRGVEQLATDDGALGDGRKILDGTATHRPGGEIRCKQQRIYKAAFAPDHLAA
jgi:hypothetical protein